MAQPKSGTKKKRRKKKKKATTDDAPASSGPSTVKTAVRSGGGGGVLTSMREGFKRAAGAGDEPKEKPSRLSNILWTVLLLAAVGFLIYRWYG